MQGQLHLNTLNIAKVAKPYVRVCTLSGNSGEHLTWKPSTLTVDSSRLRTHTPSAKVSGQNWNSLLISPSQRIICWCWDEEMSAPCVVKTVQWDGPFSQYKTCNWGLPHRGRSALPFKTIAFCITERRQMSHLLTAAVRQGGRIFFKKPANGQLTVGLGDIPKLKSNFY